MYALLLYIPAFVWWWVRSCFGWAHWVPLVGSAESSSAPRHRTVPHPLEQCIYMYSVCTQCTCKCRVRKMRTSIMILPRKMARHSGWAWFGWSLWPHQSLILVTTSKIYDDRRRRVPLCWKGLGRTLSIGVTSTSYTVSLVGHRPAISLTTGMGLLLMQHLRSCDV